jgi:SAM-dependent methyltransferase
MTRNIHQEVHEDLCHADSERISFTRRAFQLLPRLQGPSILDVGCGKGDPTLELARLTDGVVIGVDIDQASLIELSRRADEQGLSKRVQALNCSVHDMTFPDESFDIIWAEASIHIVGYERGLDDWRRFLKPGGFLVVHEMAWLRPDPPQEIAARWRRVYSGIRTIPEYIAEIPHHGYVLAGHFALPDNFWWHHYYRPLETRIAELRVKYYEDRELMGQLEQVQREVDLYKKYPGWYGSAFFVMQKRALFNGPA